MASYEQRGAGNGQRGVTKERRGPSCDDPDFVARASDIFKRDLFDPMCERARFAPDDVRALMAEFRRRIDALDMVVGSYAGAPDEPATGQRALHEVLTQSVEPDGAGAASNGVQQAERPDDSECFDDIGRNQRSRLRELTLLDFLSGDTRAFALQQVLKELQAKGFGDSSGAVVSQLHRLKKLGVIEQPANGMYVITDQGLSYRHKLRADFGSLLGNGG